jgi:hypothetical protein
MRGGGAEGRGVWLGMKIDWMTMILLIEMIAKKRKRFTSHVLRLRSVRKTARSVPLVKG